MEKKLVPILLALLITACASSIPAATDTLVPSETPAATLTMTSTPFLPTITSQPEEAQLNIWNLDISSKGQLVFRIGNELAPNVPPRGPFYDAASGALIIGKDSDNSEFVNISERAMHQIWSPDGEWLFYFEPDNIDQPFQSGEYFLWNTTDKKSISIAEVIDDFPTSTEIIHFGEAHWSPDSQKLMFLELIRPAENNFDFGIVSIVNLEKRTVIHSEEFFKPYDVRWLHNDKFLVASACGSPCVFLKTFEYPSMEGWQSIPAIVFGHYAISQDGTLVVNAGRVEPYEPIIDQIDVVNRELNILWNIPEGEFPTIYNIEPSISPDNRYVVFALDDTTNEKYITKHYIFDLETDMIISSFEKGEVANWRPNGGLVVKEWLNQGGYKFTYWPLSSMPNRLILEPGSEIYERKEDITLTWSPNGQYLLLNIVNERDNFSELYLWDFDNEQPIQIANSGLPSSIQTIWTDDSDSFYYVLPNEIILYSIDTATTEIVFPAND